ncbi:exodeoxyribonuclease V subunit beta [Variovorax sp. J22P168]|uniref:exodeoxyribonuclease V subunit beta n=1 Tax=Variovorax jilinensis TaxID=3053513 RepID=UPI002577D59B|nr:exodeoxyribonuclease V subunit beta [Variovorax sp. J22P168]MDM0012469.1 exodeoxyribonuclease V subunit beta [Variovorax sp. J22P168]
MNSADPVLLDPLRFPLRGSRLIEASAGTGKTFTIAALYLRLVLGHGGDAAFARPLVPPEILVVTFTEAATQELRDRIRARLAEAAEAFLADPVTIAPQPAGRDLLHDLRAEYPSSQWLQCARTLRLAAEWMDEAAVSTIHGWCNRMLREHAFDSGSLFTQTLETDQRELQSEVVRDYWRSFLAPLDARDAELVRGWWETPEALQKALEKLVGLGDALGEGLPPVAALQAHREQRAASLTAMKRPWRQWVDELQLLLDDAVAGKKVEGRKLQARFYQPWLEGLRTWAGNDEVQPLDDKSTGWSRLTPQGLAEVFKDGHRAPVHPALDDMLTLKARLQALPDGRHDLLRHAARWTAARLDREQARRAQMGFDELLSRLDAALHGPNGERLRALIRRQFPVALIDEFQDTDPLQYRIFDAVYDIAADAQDAAVVLIGDPKQAIYAFRGADIHTYLSARRDTAGRHATLGTNFRSTGAMVDAVNRVFMQAEQRAEGQGAFLFRTGGDNPLPFLPVAARGRDAGWCIDGAPAPALTCWTLEAGAAPSKDKAQTALAEACASEIVRLLDGGSAGRSGFTRLSDGALRPVKPGDVAVLVNSGREAASVRRSLAVRGVRSVYLSDKDSVFQAAVAADLQRWLQACAEPDDDRPLRAALGSATLALDWVELDRLNHDELQWESRVLQFRRYQQTWRRQGVLPMVRHLLNDFGVPQRLLAAGDERALTDLLHLAELLQQASAQLDGEHALIRWLAEQRQDEGSDNEVRKLRLESDADLVKVVTVHKSKGLEYPLVFLPFATFFRAARADDLPFKWHDDAGRLVVALQADARALARVDHERLGEDLRKLYVALTRARFATWVGVAPLEGVERSALGYLLGGGEALSPIALQQALESLAALSGGDGAIAVRAAPPASEARFDPVAAEAPLAPEPALSTAARERWWVASYSALSRAGEHLDDEAALAIDEPETRLALPPTPSSAAEDIYADSRSDPPPMDDVPARATLGADAGGLHGFPRGANPGSFLHGLLEWVGRQGFARVRSDPAMQADLADLIARRCNLGGWSAWTGPLRDWLLAWLATPLELGALGAGAVAPADLGRVQIEMEFWFAVHRVDLRALDALVCRHTLGGAPRPPLQPQQLNGMLKGYVDLVFAHEGRYYVADYKSNWLGAHDADYTPAALRAQVLAHRYELQYVLYVFALHRLLRSRLPDYDYERHVGGAVYLFLRGHAAPTQGLHAERPPKALIDALDRLFASDAQAAEPMEPAA